MRLIVILKLKIAAGREAEFEQFMEERVRAIKKMPAARQVYLLSPVAAEKEFRLVTWWDQLKDHEAWVRRESYEMSESPHHAGLIVGPILYEVAHVVREW